MRQRETSPSETSSGTASEGEEGSDEETAPVNISAVSFGALARAQASLPPPERRAKKAGAEMTEDDSNAKISIREPRKKEEKVKPPKRSSKHAPQEQSSKKPVSRRREILADPRRKFRDPRFDPPTGHFDESKSKKAYAFLDDYRDSEIADLRAQVKKTKDGDAKEVLKRQLLSMESKKKTRLRKEEAERVLAEHRQQEKDLVAQGKKPFYLKKSEQKKQMLTNRYESMSKGQVERAIERKRKKMAGKEKKELGALERVRSRR
ncbi:hypothetical protein RJ55_05749 [Drechmeria coniospora]|nr:hypothetical protein RJ55_05749 [Drechmeria coniospora]